MSLAMCGDIISLYRWPGRRARYNVAIAGGRVTQVGLVLADTAQKAHCVCVSLRVYMKQIASANATL